MLVLSSYTLFQRGVWSLKAHVTLVKDENNLPLSLIIRKGGRKVRVKYDITATGKCVGFDVEGDRSLMPSLSELLDIADRKMNIQPEITAITEVQTLTHVLREIIVNPACIYDFLGWHVHKNVQIEERLYQGSVGKSWKFPANLEAWLGQGFPIPLGVDWFTEIYFSLLGKAENIIQVHYVYTDQSDTQENFQGAGVDTWVKRTMAPTAGKYLESILFYHPNTWASALVDKIYTVV